MHALMINVTYNDQPGARDSLDNLVPMVSGQPGFVAGYWIELASDKGVSVVIFDSEASAQASADMARSAPAGTVTMDSIKVGEVLAHA